jgi:hypothetical protein
VWWQVPFRANHPNTINATSPIVYGDLVLVSGYQVGSLCLRVLPDESYEVLWRGKQEVLDSHYNNLVCLDGYVYGFGTVGGGLRCLELETRRLMWRWKSRLRNAASIALGDYLERVHSAAELRNARQRAGLSLADVSKRSGLDRAAISRLENGVCDKERGVRQSHPGHPGRYAHVLGLRIRLSRQANWETELA